MPISPDHTSTGVRTMPNTAILYYSRTGTTRQAAQLLAQRLGCPVFEVFDRVRRAGLWGDLRCIVDNLLRRRVAYCYAGPVLNDYISGSSSWPRFGWDISLPQCEAT